MKKGFILVSLLSLLLNSLHAHKAEHFTLDCLTVPYDSIVYVLNQENISFEAKYDFINKASDYSSEKQIALLNKIISSNAVKKDNNTLVFLYSNLGNTYLTIKELQKGEENLKNALKYANSSTDDNLSATLHYYIGNFHLDTDKLKSLESYWTAMLYCDKTKDSEITKLKILYKICAIYNANEDFIGFKNNLDQMLHIARQIDTPDAYFLTFPVIATYHIRIVNDINLSDEEYYKHLDSVYLYNEKIVKIYESHNEEFKKQNASSMSLYYSNFADVIIVKDNDQWQKALATIDKSSQLLQPTDTLSLTKNMQVKARILFNQKQYNKAKDQAFKTLDVINGYSGNTNLTYYDIYRILRETYTAQKDYKNALHYEELRNEVQKKINETNQYKSTKELEIKYETVQKDLEISQLNERQQALLYNRMLLITISVIVVILLLLIILYFRIKKQQREKEAILKDKIMEEKEYKYQVQLKEMESTQMRHYLDGLEAERSRLAKELHDNIANELYAATLEMNRTKSRTTNITNTMIDLHTQIRNISHDLMPPQFQYASILDILYNHLIIVERQTHIKFQLLIEDENNLELLSPSFSHEIYRIIQECTGNIIKHSSATTATIRLSSTENKVKISVEDDGIGFDPSKINKGIGLHIIQERCNSLKASLQVTSRINHGCKVVVIIPVNGFDK